MAQHFFNGESTSDKALLDANFNDVYDMREIISTPSYTAANVLVTIGSTGSISSKGSSFSLVGAASVGVLQLDGSSNAFHNGVSHTFRNAAGSTTFAKIDSAGNLNVGTTATNFPNPGWYFSPTGAGRVGNNAGATGAAFLLFSRSATDIGGIVQNGTTGVSYNTSSDYRLKTNVQPISAVDSGAFVDALKPCNFDWIADGTADTGFIAHELQEVSPRSVTGDKDASIDTGDIRDDQGQVVAVGVARPEPGHMPDSYVWTKTGQTPVYQQVEYGSAEVIAMLVAELQQLRLRVAALEAAGAH